MPGRDEILTHPVTMYAKQVTAGRLKKNCGPYEIKACQRHLDDLRRQLKTAVGKEDYETAAKLHAEIKQLEGGASK